jgi:hypothetical protein
MSQYPNSGSLNPNKYKTADKHPDFYGQIKTLDKDLVDLLAAGKPVNIAGWSKEGVNGSFMSLSFSEPKEKEQTESKSAF